MIELGITRTAPEVETRSGTGSYTDLVGRAHGATRALVWRGGELGDGGRPIGGWALGAVPEHGKVGRAGCDR